MPSITFPLFGPSVIVTSMVFGDFDTSSFCVPTWITSSPFLTVCFSPSKVRMNSFSSSVGRSVPPASLDSNVQEPWNFLVSFSRSSLSSSRVAEPADAARPTAQQRAAKKIRIPVLLDMYEDSDTAAELVILSRKRIDRDGPKRACQSAIFPMTQWVRTISAARTAVAFVLLLAGRPLNLATGG